MADLRGNVMSVELAIQRELAYRRKLTILNALPDEPLIPLQVRISSSKSAVVPVKQPALPSNPKQPSGNASSRSIGSWNPNLSGERRPAQPNNQEHPGGNASPIPILSPNPCHLRERQAAPNSQEIPRGTASSRPMSSNPNYFREKPAAIANNQQLSTGNASSRPTSISNPSVLRERQISSTNPRLLGGRPPTILNSQELPTRNASPRPIMSSNPSLSGVKRPAVPNSRELIIGNASSRPSSISNPLSSGVNHSGQSAHVLQVQVMQTFSQSDTLMPRADSLFCEVCKVQCSGPLNYKQHINGKKHWSKKQELKFGGIKDRGDDSAVGNKRGRKWCSLCRIWCMNDDNMKMHLAGQKHKTEQDRLLHAQTGEMIEQQKWGDLCGIGGTDGLALQMHLDGKRHKAELSLRECRRKSDKYVEKQTRYCKLCDIWCTDESSLQSHLKGKKHVWQVVEVKKRDGWLVPVLD